MNNELLEKQRNIERMRKCIGDVPEDNHTTKKFQNAFKKVKHMYQEAEMQESNLR